MKKVCTSILSIILCFVLLCSCNVSNPGNATTGGETVPSENTTQKEGTESKTETDTATDTETETKIEEIDLGGLTGKNAAELLLAQLNLDESVLKGEITIDEDLDSELKWDSPFINFEYLSYLEDEEGEPELGYDSMDENVYGKCTYENDVLEWSKFPQYSTPNGNRDFITNFIGDYAKSFAELIETIKNEIQVTDKWIRYNDKRFLLSVGENYEIVFAEVGKQYGGDFDDQIDLCLHYISENGQDIYEMYSTHFMEGGANGHTNNTNLYMKFIDGYWYEFVETFDLAYEDQEPYFWTRLYLIENTRGYWNMFFMDHTGTREDATFGFSCSNVVFRDGLVYQIAGGVDSVPAESWIVSDYVISTDANDIIKYYPNADGLVMINSNAFKNLSSIKLYSPIIESNFSSEPVEGANVFAWMHEGETGALYESTIFPNYDFEIVLSDEKALTSSDFSDYNDGDMVLNSISIGFGEKSGYQSTLIFNLVNLYSESTVGFSEIADKLYPAFKKLGLKLEMTQTDLVRSITEAEVIGEHFKEDIEWNGYKLDTMSNISAAFSEHYKLSDELYERYLSVKDCEAADPNKFSESFMDKIDFSDITELGFSEVSLNDNLICVEGLYAKLPQYAVLLDDGIQYVIKLGLCTVNDDGSLSNKVVSLLSVDTELEPSVYVKGQGCTLEQSGKYIVPKDLKCGRYALVAYVSTFDDGIRVSETVPIVFHVSDGVIDSDEANIKFRATDSLIIFESSELIMHKADISTDSCSKVDDLYQLLRLKAIFLGNLINGEYIELYNAEDDTAIPVNAQDELQAGIYRLKYRCIGSNKEIRYVYCIITSEMLGK